MKKTVNGLYESRKFIRIILMLLAIVISITTLYLSQLLVVKIAGEEKKKMEMWAEAESILSDPYSEGDLGFQLRVVQSNTTIPAILVDEKGDIIQFVNMDTVGTDADYLLWYRWMIKRIIGYTMAAVRYLRSCSIIRMWCWALWRCLCL
ncbi:MAG: hypothetical protein RL712_729 [Bacteroidota bacterium]